MVRNSTDMVQLKIRLPAAIRRRLAESAEANRRTLTAEILFRLEDSYKTDATTREAMAAIEGGLMGRLHTAMKQAQAAREELDKAMGEKK